MKKYRILIDYGSEGFKFFDESGFESLDEAVKTAQTNNYGNQFSIVTIIDWKAEEK